MKKIKNTQKMNFFKKIFIKLCRLFDFEIIDQANLHLPVINKKISQNLANGGQRDDGQGYLGQFRNNFMKK